MSSNRRCRVTDDVEQPTTWTHSQRVLRILLNFVAYNFENLPYRPAFDPRDRDKDHGPCLPIFSCTPSHQNPMDIDQFLKGAFMFLLFLTGLSIRVRPAKARRRPAAKSASTPLLLVVAVACCCCLLC
jgi:hypothetical protein